MNYLFILICVGFLGFFGFFILFFRCLLIKFLNCVNVVLDVLNKGFINLCCLDGNWFWNIELLFLVL